MKIEEPKSLNEAKLLLTELGKNMQEHAYRIGKILLWVKTELEHGDLEEWIEENLWFSSRTGRRFMAFAEKCDEKGKLLNEPHYLEKEKTDNLSDLKESLPLPKGKYQIIYADPPWFYGQEQHGKEEQETVLASHYPSMPTEDICALPIKDLAADNSVLFLWTTSPKLFESKSVIDAWGFDYKTSMIWDKVKHNVGYYVSVRHEFLLICTRGSYLPDSNKLVDSVQTIERTKHSEKPERFYEIIEEMYQGKKIELFSRKKRKEWDSWGNQL